MKNFTGEWACAILTLQRHLRKEPPLAVIPADEASSSTSRVSSVLLQFLHLLDSRFREGKASPAGTMTPNVTVGLTIMRKKTLRTIAERFGVTRIYLFGSQAEEGRRYTEGQEIFPDPFSDLDVAVVFEKPPAQAIEVYGRLYSELAELFSPFNIDLLFMHEVDTFFQYEIIQGVKMYERDESITDEFEERIMKRAEDLSFKKKVCDREVMEAMEDGYIEFTYIPNP